LFFDTDFTDLYKILYTTKEGGYNPITGPIELQVERGREEEAKILLAELIKDLDKS